MTELEVLAPVYWHIHDQADGTCRMAWGDRMLAEAFVARFGEDFPGPVEVVPLLDLVCSSL